jgi:Tfp pilus assembly protein PilP
MMKPTVTILVCVMAAGLATAQSPSVIQNTRDAMNGVSNQQTAASNEALGVRSSTSAVVNASQVSKSQISTKQVSTKQVPAKQVSVKPAPAKSVPAKSVRVEPAAGNAKRSAFTRRREVGLRPGIVAVGGTTNGTPNGQDDASLSSAAPANSGAAENMESEQSVVPDAKYNANGRRDPFISPVVSKAGGSGCSTGKKCLEIGAINLRGVVHSESGFIAVVSNNMNKAYFLKENDPVFNGYVVKITGDSIVFQETLQDRLGKTFTREVVKKITTPAV